jgi:hypothetical protein
MYTNQGVAGGVTVVPQNVMRGRQPISSSVVLPVDARTVSTWRQEQPSRQPAVPVAPPPRVTAVPGGAVPAVPGAQRNTPWGQQPGRVSAAQGDGGQAQHGSSRNQGRERRGDDAPPQSRREQGREQGREQDHAERRVMPVVPPLAVPGMRPVQPVMPAQPQQQAVPSQPRQQPQQQQQVQQVPSPAVQVAPGAAPPQVRGHQQEGRAERPPGPPQHRAQRGENRDDGGERGDRGQRRGESREQQNR